MDAPILQKNFESALNEAEFQRLVTEIQIMKADPIIKKTDRTCLPVFWVYIELLSLEIYELFEQGI